MSFSLHGVGASKGIAIGRLHVVERGSLEVVERRLQPRQLAREVTRFETGEIEVPEICGPPADFERAEP